MTQIVPGLLFAAALLVSGAVRGAESDASVRTIVVLGDSIAAGLGVEPGEAFPAVLQGLVDQKKFPFRVVNAGVSGDTTSSGSRRINWLLKRPVDVLIIELGGNDALRGISPDTTSKNLKTIITKARSENPNVRIILSGMQIHQNMGADYTAAFKALFGKLANSENVVLVPFLLESVGGDPELNQADQIHPNKDGHRIVAQNVWKALEPVLKEMTADNAEGE